METFLRNKSFQVDFILQYKDRATAINLDLLDEIDVVVYNSLTKAVLLNRKLSLSEVNKTNASLGMCSIYINPSETVSAPVGAYEYIITIEFSDENYTSGIATPAGEGKCFILK